MRKIAICIFILLGIVTNEAAYAHAGIHMDSQNPNEESLNNPEPNVSNDFSTLPLPMIVQNIFEDQAPAPIDPGGPLNNPFDPGTDPNAPIDSKMWILLLFVLILGIYTRVKEVKN